jgi:hypothetical protein
MAKKTITELARPEMLAAVSGKNRLAGRAERKSMKAIFDENLALGMKTLSVIDSCNTLEQLNVAGKFAKRVLKELKFPFIVNHWDAMFHLTIDMRAEEIRSADEDLIYI